MKRRRRVSMMSVAFVLLFALVAAFLLRLSFHRPPAVTLPDLEQSGHDGDAVEKTQQDAVRRVEVTPQTVQLVIERLSRPQNYRRTVFVERHWDDGVGIVTAAVAVADGWTRVDQTNSSSDTRHSIVSPQECWIWYGEERSVFHGAAAFTADEEQSIPTYEDILNLDAEDIAAADYRALDGVNCIYVETAPDASGYTERYYIAVDNGLLVSMERMQEGAMVYRMFVSSLERDVVDAESFTLPDGTALYDPSLQNEEKSEGA